MESDKCQAAGTVCKRGQIQQEFEDLSNCVYANVDLIQVLLSNLVPILSEAEDVVEKSLASPISLIAPLADSLRSVRFKAEESKRDLQYILSHIEL